MPNQLFDWLNQQQPPAGLDADTYPQAGDISQPESENENVWEIPNYQRPEHPDPSYQPSTAGVYGPEGSEMLPYVANPLDVNPAPNPSVVGKEGEVNAWDYSFELVPVYRIPPELGGGEYVGPLEYAPSLPQNLQPVRFVKVPRSEKMV